MSAAKKRLERIIKSVPVDRVAARAVSPGVVWEPKLGHKNHFRSDIPPAVKMPRPGEPDITGQRFGRLVVIGMTTEKVATGNAKWVVRCDCGFYERRKMSVLKKNPAARMCSKCNRLEERKAGLGPWSAQ